MYPKGSDSSKFAEDMSEAGWDVEHYHGRFFYEGPAVRPYSPAELQSVIRATDVQLNWDSLGEGYIVFPLNGTAEITDD